MIDPDHPDEALARLLAADGTDPDAADPALRDRAQQAHHWLRQLERARPASDATPADDGVLALVARELELRRALGQSTGLDDYQQHVPEFADRLRALAAEPPAAAPPQVPGYRVLRELGRGGMGVVYEAEQLRLKRRVALKMVPAAGLATRADVGRFLAEAEAIARLRHPNVVQVYEVGQCGGVPFFAMELCAGGSLARRLADERSPEPRAAAALVAALARAAQHAHEQGVVHRDLKPANILLQSKSEIRSPKSESADSDFGLRISDFSPKVSDFGLAYLEGSDRTATGQVLGTPAYMAPEQADGRRAGPVADVYALGAILYECLTGRPPFKAATPAATLHLVLTADPPAPRQLKPGVPRDLETVALKCLQKEPRRRYASAAALADDLERFLRREPVSARPVAGPVRLALWARRRPAVAALVLASAVAAFSLPVAVLGALYNTRLTDSLEKTREARKAEADARQAEQEASRKAEEFHYFHRIALAGAEWRDARIARVEALLAECPAGLRRWEWHYLKRLCRPQALTLAHEAPVYSGAISEDGRLAAAGGEDRVATIWDAATGRRLRTLRGHTASVHDVRFNRAGDRIITAASDKTVRIWDAVTGIELMSFTGHTDGVRAALFGPDGRWAASTGKDGRVMIWNAATGSLLHDLQGFGRGNGLAVSADGGQLAYGTGHDVAVWDPRTGRPLHRLTAAAGHVGVRGVAFHPAGDRLAVATDDGAVRIWDLAAGAVRLTLKGHAGTVYAVAYSADGRRLASAGLDAVVRVWDADSGEELGRHLGHTSRINTVAFSADGSRLASASIDKSLKVWDLAGAREAVAIAAHEKALTVCWSADGDRIASGGDDGLVKVWEADSGRLLFPLTPGGSPVHRVAFSPDGRWLAASTSAGAVWVWEAATGRPIHVLRGHAGAAQGLAFSPDSRRLATGGKDQTARVWDVAGGRELLCYRDLREEVQTLAFSPDGRWVASAGDDQTVTVKVWDAATGRTAWSVADPVRTVRGITWSPDGRQVATANFDGAVKLRDAATGEVVRQLNGHIYSVNGLAWSRDGERLATASVDRTIMIWQGATGQQALILRGHTDEVNAVAWSPDGRRLASAGRDGTIRIWDGTPLPPPAGAP